MLPPGNNNMRGNWESTNAQKILFVTYGGGHADIVKNLFPVVAKSSTLEPKILALTTAGPTLEKAGIPFFSCKDLLFLADYSEALPLGERLYREMAGASALVSREESVAYLGISMLDLIKKIGEGPAWEAYRSVGRRAFCPTRFMQVVLDFFQPEIVLTTCHVRMERAATMASRNFCLSIIIEDLFGYSLLGTKPFSATKPAVPKEEWPKKIFVLNECIRQLFLRCGFEKDRVVATGQPVFSNWVSRLALTKDQGRGRGAGTRLVVTYIAPPKEDVLVEQVPLIIALARKHPDWKIALKLHPSTDFLSFLRRFPDAKKHAQVLHQEDVFEVVASTDILITFQSTVGMLAFLRNIPLIILNGTGESDVLPYVSQGGATGVQNYNQLESAIVEARQRSKATVAVPPVFEIQEGAVERIVSILENLGAHS